MIELISSKQVQATTWSFFGEIEEFRGYAALIKELYNAEDGDIITLNINSPGGRVDIGRSIITAMHHTKAVVHCHVESDSCSMAALIAVSGDSMTMSENTYLMFHNYSTGMYGKGGDLAKQMQYEQESIYTLFKAWCTPFLTMKEFTAMLAGEDIYIKDSDPTLAARIKRHFK